MKNLFNVVLAGLLIALSCIFTLIFIYPVCVLRKKKTFSPVFMTGKNVLNTIIYLNSDYFGTSRQILATGYNLA